MNPSRTYAKSGAFRKALEDRLWRIGEIEQVDLNRLTPLEALNLLAELKKKL